MVGTPQLPLKYRRKGDTDYRVYTPDLDMSFHSPTSSFNSYNLGSECSMPRSPTFYSSSSSNAPSSPIRSLHTPEPPSSPFTEPYIASSPKSPKSDGRKGFWEVAFNYGPDFPYKGRPLADTHIGREQFLTRRRSSSASAPALVSDIDPSEYSEDNDPFHMDDDVMDEVDTTGSVTIVNSRDELDVSGSEVSALPQDDAVDVRNAGKVWDGEIDVAAVLLDLSRQVRIAPVESRAVSIATKTIGLPTSDLAQEENPTSASGQSSQAVEETNGFTPVVSEIQLDISPVSCGSAQSIELSNLNERETDIQHDFSEAAGVRSENSESATGVSGTAVEEPCSTEELKISAASQGTRADTDISSENVAIGNVETAITSNLVDEIQLSTEESLVIVDEGTLVVGSIVESIFSSELTPLSSPILTANEIGYLNEPLSELSSPGIDVLELTGPFKPTDDTRHLKESDDLDVASRPSSPVPGPSNSRSGSADQHAALTKCKSGQSQKGSRKSRPSQSVLDVKAKESEQPDAKKSGKKRARSVSGVESRPSSPSPSASCPDVPKPRKKKSRKIVEDSASQNEDGSVLTDPAHSPSSSLSAPTLPAHDSSSAPRDTEMVAELPCASEDDDTNARAEICGCLIQAMALSRASSMPTSSLLREVLRENPHLNNQRSKADWLGVVAVVLSSHEVFGRIDREGLDADDKPLEAQWFYIPENDPDQDRASLLREMMPKKRSETKKHKQYFYKPLGKISRWDAEDAP